MSIRFLRYIYIYINGHPLKDQGPSNTPIVDEEGEPEIVNDLGQHMMLFSAEGMV